MANYLLLSTCLLIQSTGAIAQSVSVIGSAFVPVPTTVFDNMLMPDVTYTSEQLISAIATTTHMPQPTPSTDVNISPSYSDNSSGSGLILDLFSTPQTSQSRIFTSYPTMSPSPTTVPQPVPKEDIVIKLRLTYSVDITTDEERMLIGRNLSLLIQDLLQLSIPPKVNISQETGNIYTVLIVSSSSMDAGVASGNISAVCSLLLDGISANTELLRVDAIEIISVTKYESSPAPPPMTIDHLDFPLWQWFVYAACAIIAVTAITLLICACCYRWSWKRNEQSRRRQGYKYLLQSPRRPVDEMVDFVQSGDLQEHDPAIARKVSRISFRPRGPMQLLSHPLTPEELLDFTLNPIAVYTEYSSIPSNMVTMAEVPPGAEEKNRFKDVLPNPHTRVALFLKFAVPNSDYINANYIRGYRDTPKAYIATQGPLYWTIADFWRMVWEQKCSTIIMVTGLEERGINKCARYWPDERVQHITTYEDLELMLKRKTSNKSFTTTTFHLRHKQKLVTREVTHFWFTAWPDHGVPSSARPVVEFLLKARHHIRDIPGPTVVHCSAGIGRTGVFIGAEIGMQLLDEKGEVDILKIVSTLRQDRGGMVQTKDQYLFLYQVLVEYSNYLDEVRSPYKVPSAAAHGHGLARQPIFASSSGASPVGPMVAAQSHVRRHVELEPPREEEEEEEEDGEEGSSSTE